MNNFNKYSIAMHGVKMSSYLNSSKSNKIEKQLKLFHVLFSMFIASDNENYVFFGANRYLTTELKKYCPIISDAEIKVYLNRLADANLIKIKYNPTLSKKGQNSYYSTELPNGYNIANNRSIDTSITHWREISINIDYVCELASVTDLKDPLFENASMRSVIRKFIKKRAFTSTKKYNEKIDTTLDRLSESNVIVSNKNTPLLSFISKISNLYFNVHTKMKIATSKINKKVEVPEVPDDPDRDRLLQQIYDSIKSN